MSLKDYFSFLKLKPRTPEEDVNWGESQKQDGRLWELYAAMTNISYRRTDIYRDLDFMDDELISRALDMTADDSTSLDPQRNKVVWITSKDPNKTKVLESMFKRIGVQERLWLWARETSKYGDFFLGLNIGENRIEAVNDWYHPSSLVRLDRNGKLVGFLKVEGYGKGTTYSAPLKPWEFVHFRTLKYRIIDDLLPDNIYSKYIIDRNGRYGSSTFLKSRRLEKKLRLAEDSLVLARLARSMFYRVHFVNVGSSDLKEQKRILKNYSKLFQKNEAVDYTNDYYKSKKNPLSYADEVFVPVKNNDKGSSQIQDYGGDIDVTSIVDIEYLNNMRFGSMGIPKEYMSFESTLSYNSLASLDPRYARKISTLQKDLLVGLTILCQIELYMNNLDADPNDFEVHLSSVSPVNDLE